MDVGGWEQTRGRWSQTRGQSRAPNVIDCRKSEIGTKTNNCIQNMQLGPLTLTISPNTCNWAHLELVSIHTIGRIYNCPQYMQLGPFRIVPNTCNWAHLELSQIHAIGPIYNCPQYMQLDPFRIVPNTCNWAH